MSEENRMTQPDLVSKLREALRWALEHLEEPDFNYPAFLAKKNELESLLGLEGQAASSVNPAWKDEALQSRINEAVDAAQEPCGPSQPETVREGYKGICVCGHRSGAHHESDPSCEFCACKSYRDVSAWGGSPSTPIVPSTAGLSAEYEPIYTHFDPQTHMVTVIPVSVEAQIRKDVLEEAKWWRPRSATADSVIRKEVEERIAALAQALQPEEKEK